MVATIVFAATTFLVVADTPVRDWVQEQVLFRLSDEELSARGISQTAQPGTLYWAVAWADDSDPSVRAIGGPLKREGIPGFASCGHGMCSWYVDRKDFFRARRALLGSPSVRALDIKVPEPRLVP